MSRKKKEVEGDEELEKLELELKKLKSENRHLHKELKRNNKKYKPHHKREDLIEEEYKEKLYDCEQCGKGKIISTELGPRKLLRCSVCEYRKTIKNAGNKI